MTDLNHPLHSLREGHWFKLICGASFQHLPAVRNLTLAYTLAGADCIDVAADPAVIAAAQDAIQTAQKLAETVEGWEARLPHRLPWLMVSLNDGEDPHFRKALFSPELCPADCPRPCQLICPAQAIVFDRAEDGFSGVIDQRCYGCGRCLPICPIQQVSTRAYVATPETIIPLVLQSGVDAVEIHTQIGRLTDFQRLWRSLSPWVHQLKLLAISCPDGEGLIDYLRALYDTIAPLPCALIWQTDGRPMSGDIGAGATRAAVKLGQKVLNAKLPGYVQLAGGTNDHTVAKLKSEGLLHPRYHPWKTPPSAHQAYIAGIAYGSYARQVLTPVLEQLEQTALEMPPVFQSLEGGGVYATRTFPLQLNRLEESPDLLWQAVTLAHSLVAQLKSSVPRPVTPF